MEVPDGQHPRVGENKLSLGIQEQNNIIILEQRINDYKTRGHLSVITVKGVVIVSVIAGEQRALV